MVDKRINWTVRYSALFDVAILERNEGGGIFLLDLFKSLGHEVTISAVKYQRLMFILVAQISLIEEDRWRNILKNRKRRDDRHKTPQYIKRRLALKNEAKATATAITAERRKEKHRSAYKQPEIEAEVVKKVDKCARTQPMLLTSRFTARELSLFLEANGVVKSGTKPVMKERIISFIGQGPDSVRRGRKRKAEDEGLPPTNRKKQKSEEDQVEEGERSMITKRGRPPKGATATKQKSTNPPRKRGRPRKGATEKLPGTMKGKGSKRKEKQPTKPQVKRRRVASVIKKGTEHKGKEQASAEEECCGLDTSIQVQPSPAIRMCEPEKVLKLSMKKMKAVQLNQPQPQPHLFEASNLHTDKGKQKMVDEELPQVVLLLYNIAHAEHVGTSQIQGTNSLQAESKAFIRS